MEVLRFVVLVALGLGLVLLTFGLMFAGVWLWLSLPGVRRWLVQAFDLLVQGFVAGWRELVAIAAAAEVVPRMVCRELRGFGFARDVEEVPLPPQQPWARFTVETPGLTGWTDWIGFELELEFELGLRKRLRTCCEKMPLSHDGRCPVCGRFAQSERVVLVAEPVRVVEPSLPMVTVVCPECRGLRWVGSSRWPCEWCQAEGWVAVDGRTTRPASRSVADTVAATDSLARAAQVPQMDRILE